MSILHSIILGIIEGITEFLPISSTGHLILASKVLGIAQSEFLKSFEIFIQLGAILAVVVYYRKTLFSGLSVWKKIIAAFIPTGIIGLLLYKTVKTYLLGNGAVVAIALIIGGIVLIVFEMYQKKKENHHPAPVGHPSLEKEGKKYDSIAEVPYTTACAIGALQAIAVIPGVSRSATTIIGGQLLSLTRKAVVEFSFLLAIPTMLAASGLDLLKSGASFTGSEIVLLLVGFVVSFVVALVVIKWLLKYIERHSFIAFGIYRIIIGLFFFWLL